MATQFTVMTWNVENLFPVGYPISPQKVVAPADYDAKLDYLAQVITTVGPHVVALQEIGSAAVDDTRSFDDLHHRLQAQYPSRALSQYPDQRGIRVGFLSRLPILRTDHLIAFALGELSSVPDWFPRPPSTRLGRGALRIVVEPVPGIPIHLVTVHLKSKLITYPASRGKPRFSPRDEHERAIGGGLALLRRTAEALGVRDYLNTLMQAADGSHMIVLGDFNDEPQAATSQLILGPQDADVTTGDKFDHVRLYNLMDAIPRRNNREPDKQFLPDTERYTRVYRGRQELIDHILVSKGLLGPTDELRHDHWRLKEVHSLVPSITGQSIEDNPADRVGKERPDHAPVYARFDL